MKRLFRLLLATSFGVLSLSAAAAADKPPTMQPGLWEMQLGGDLDQMMAAQQGDIDRELADMPAEQQARMREMMTGMLDRMRAPSRRCVTAEQAASAFENMGNTGGCERTLTWKSATEGDIASSCPDGVTEKGRITVTEGRKLAMTTTLTQPGQEPLTLTAESRWLSADCGSASR